MCEPMTMMALMAAASTAVGIRQQGAAAEATAESAHAAAINQSNDLQARQAENNLRTSQELSERQRQHMRERSRIRASTAESGLSGISPLRNLVTSNINAALDLDTINLNSDLTSQQSMRNQNTVAAQRQSRIDAAMGQVPSAFGSLLQIGQAGLGGFNAGANVSARMSKTKGTY